MNTKPEKSGGPKKYRSPLKTLGYISPVDWISAKSKQCPYAPSPLLVHDGIKSSNPLDTDNPPPSLSFSSLSIHFDSPAPSFLPSFWLFPESIRHTGSRRTRSMMKIEKIRREKKGDVHTHLHTYIHTYMHIKLEKGGVGGKSERKPSLAFLDDDVDSTQRGVRACVPF